MSAVQSLGIGSGVDVAKITKAIVDAEKVPQETTLKNRKLGIDAKISALGEMRGKVDTFQSALSSLRKTSTFSAFEGTSSDEDVFTASANTLAEVGTHSIKVTQLAQKHTLATAAFSATDETIGTGTLTIRFGTTVYDADTDVYTSFTQNSTMSSKTITIDSTNNSLSTMKDYINSNDLGLSASIVYDGTDYRLVLASENAGAKNSMEIVVSGDGDGNNTDTSGLSRLAFNSSTTNTAQTIKAQDANLTIDGLAITSESNSITTAITGVTLNLTGTDTNAKTLTVSRDTSGIADQIKTMVTSYNELSTYIYEATDYNLATGETGVFQGDSTIRLMFGSIRNTMFSTVSGFTGDIRALADLGLISKQSDGTLELDEDALNTAISENFTDLAGLFAPLGKMTDSNLKYVSSTTDTKAGSYAINITALATKGSFNGAGVLPVFGSLAINADNDAFTISVDGTSSGAITLTQGTYTTGSSLATEIQNKINANTTLTSSGKKVTVAYNATDNRFDITSKSYGTSSTIAFGAIDTTTAATLGFSVTSGTAGVNVAGTINGKTATGAGQYLFSDEGDSKGLKLSIAGSTTGDRGTATFTRGIADQLHTLLEAYTKDGEMLDDKESGYEDSLEDIDLAKENLATRMAKLESRLLAQFSVMDALVNQLNSIGSFLTSSLKSLPGYTNK